MKSSIDLCEILKNYPEYQKFIDSIENSVDWVYSIVNDFSLEYNINIVSHLADADGFGSQILFQKGLESILGFLGNTTKTVQSERIMSFSKDESSLSSLKGLKDNWFGDGGKWIIADLASLEPRDTNKYLDDVLIVDHHKPKKGFNPKFKIVNPHLQGFDGGKELSASMISTLIINRLYERIEDDINIEIENNIYKGKSLKDLKKNLSKLRENLDYISIFGIAGSKADMQEDTGLNKAVYEYFENRGVLKKIDSPFFGYYTKDSGKVFAQSGPTFNFKYSIPEPNEFQKGFDRTFNASKGKRLTDMLSLEGVVSPLGDDKFLFDLYQDYRWAFTLEKKGFCINTYYLKDLSDDEIMDFNSSVKGWTGQTPIKVNYDSEENRDFDVLGDFLESDFEVFDDIKVMNDRVQIAENLIRDLGYDPRNSLAFESGLDSILVNKFKDNILAFGDKEDINRNLEKLEQGQYVPVNGKELANTSIPEIANLMTSMSKLRVGDIFLDAIEEVLLSTSKYNINTVNRKYGEYKLYVYNGMSSLEKKILSREELVKLSEDIYFMNVDFLKSVGEDLDIDLRQMNGVFGGISCETNLLPSGKGIFFTGTTFKERSKKYFKISGRATGSIKYDKIKINKFMEFYDGGGHKTAAASVIPIQKLDEFVESIGKFDFYEGEFNG